VPSNAFLPPCDRYLITLLVGACVLLHAGCSRNDDVPAGAARTPVEPIENPASAAPEPSAPVAAPLAAPVTVSGVSSGGYMAMQAHVALSDRIGGAAIIAAGPYHCAEGKLGKALSICLSGDALELAPLLDFVRDAAQAGKIADPGQLGDDRAWVFHSPADTVVGAAVSRAAADFYAAFLDASAITLVNDVVAAHGWPTLDRGAACEDMGGDFINACDYDASGELLAHLYGDLAPRAAGEGELRRVDVTAHLPAQSGLDDEAYLFVPRDCAGDAISACRLHVSFHGCQQGAEFRGDAFPTKVGLNEWAAGNRIVVLYPQIVARFGNPQGCWDWWGYSGSDYDLRAGLQIEAVDNLIDAFAAGELVR
jgi:hypothetical protein